MTRRARTPDRSWKNVSMSGVFRKIARIWSERIGDIQADAVASSVTVWSAGRKARQVGGLACQHPLVIADRSPAADRHEARGDCHRQPQRGLRPGASTHTIHWLVENAV
jgi:hypothetical protein